MHRPNFDSYYDPPSYDDFPCDVCGKWADDCICPECPVCGEYGNTRCYTGGLFDHGLIRTPEQESSFAAFCKSCDDEAAYYNALAEAEEEAKALEEQIEEENKEYWESITNPNRV